MILIDVIIGLLQGRQGTVAEAFRDGVVLSSLAIFSSFLLMLPHSPCLQTFFASFIKSVESLSTCYTYELDVDFWSRLHFSRREMLPNQTTNNISGARKSNEDK
jgi:hypothetical protein